MKYSLTFLFLLASIISECQVPGMKWNVVLDGYNTVYMADIAVDNEGNTFIAANYTADLTIKELNKKLPHAEHVHAMIMKISPQGKPLWAHGFNSPNDNRIKDISIASNGDLLITGFADGITNFPSLGDTLSRGNARELVDGRYYQNHNGLYAARYSTKGICVWVKYFDCAWGEGLSIAANHLDEVFVYYYQNADLILDDKIIVPFKGSKIANSKLGIIRLDGKGELIEVRPMGYEVSQSIIIRHSIEFDSQNNCIVYGVFQGKILVSSTDSIVTDGYNNSIDTYVSKLDPEGKVIWKKHFGGSHTQRIYKLVLAEDNSIYFSGGYDTECFVSNGITVTQKTEGTRTYGESIFHGHIYQNGEIDYIYFQDKPKNAYTFDPRAIALDGNGEVHVVGTYNDTLNLAGTSLPAGYHNPQGFHSLWKDGEAIELQQIGQNDEHFFHSWLFEANNLTYAGAAEYYGEKGKLFQGSKKIGLPAKDYGGSVVIYGGSIIPKPKDEEENPIASKEQKEQNQINQLKPLMACLPESTLENSLPNEWVPLNEILTSEVAPEISIPNNTELNVSDSTQTFKEEIPCNLVTISMEASVYPNPTRNALNIKILGASGQLNLEIRSAKGQLIHKQTILESKSEELIQLDVSSIASGQYLVLISTPTHQKILRFTVSK